MKKLLSGIFVLLAFCFSTSNVFAVNSPTSVDNNKFGIHVNDENEFKDASILVNSSGGDWGYVTFVITEGERNHDRWQKAFDSARRLHLIPIVRIATKADGDKWVVPDVVEIDNWVTFLNSLNWVIENRYVIIGNEPNHATEWGGKLDPAGYAAYLSEFASKLHDANKDFFVISAGMDASAKNTTNTMDEATYIKKMLTAEPDVYDKVDGLSSHSYPNPGFSGKVTDTGRGSIYTYDWELSYLKGMGVTRTLPVFITETGWSNEKLAENEIGEMYKYAFANVWNDKRVVAVTPFILNYPDEPFSEFSWRKKNGDYYSYYDAYKNMPKVLGNPVQIVSGQILGAFIQPIITTNSDFVGAILVKNTGQSIWNSNSIDITSDDGQITFKKSMLFDIEPGKTGLIVFKANTSQTSGILIKSIYLLTSTGGKRITNNFPIEAWITNTGKGEVKLFFEKILDLVKTSSNL